MIMTIGSEVGNEIVYDVAVHAVELGSEYLENLDKASNDQ